MDLAVPAGKIPLPLFMKECASQKFTGTIKTSDRDQVDFIQSQRTIDARASGGSIPW